MKNIKAFFILSLLALPFITSAQSSEAEVLRKIFSAEKRAITESFLQLNGTDANTFWALYDEYENERKALADMRIKLIQDYADQYEGLTNDEASGLVARSFKGRDAWLKLQKKYFKKMSKEVDAKTATSFLQLEQYIHTAVNFDLYDAIPFVGE